MQYIIRRHHALGICGFRKQKLRKRLIIMKNDAQGDVKLGDCDRIPSFT